MLSSVSLTWRLGAALINYKKKYEMRYERKKRVWVIWTYVRIIQLWFVLLYHLVRKITQIIIYPKHTTIVAE